MNIARLAKHATVLDGLLGLTEEEFFRTADLLICFPYGVGEPRFDPPE